jgi:hypothetical protein
VILLRARAEIRPSTSGDPGFLGSALHGLVERCLHQDGHVVEAVLGSGHDSWCRVLPPPIGHPTAPLHFGIALYGPARGKWQLVSAALGRRARYLETRTWRARIERIAIDLPAVGGPGNGACSAQGVDQHQVAEWIPPSAVPAQGAACLQLDFLTPVRLSTLSKRQAGDGAPVPQLRAIVRSAHRWVSLRAPSWLQTLPDGADITAMELEATSAVALHDDDAVPVRRWPHYRLPVQLYGRQGILSWNGRFSAPLLRLLEFGQWVGVGQGTAMGLGGYRLVLRPSSLQ